MKDTIAKMFKNYSSSSFPIILMTIVLCSLFFNRAHTQSVDEFITMAKEHNPGLEAIRINYESVKEKANQVIDYPDPNISLGLGVLPVETRLGAQRIKLGVTQVIPWKGLLNAKKEMIVSQSEALNHMDDVKEIDIEFAIRTAYNTLIFIDEKREIILEKIALLDVLGEIAKTSVKSGKGKLSNILLIERSRESMDADLLLLEKKRENPRIMINRWAGRALDMAIEIAGDKIETIDSYEDFQLYAEHGHPQFQVLESRIKASIQAVEFTKYDSKPRIAVGLDYSIIDGRNGIEIPGNGRDVLMPMGSISIPIHKGRFESKRQEEKLKQEAIKSNAQDLREMYKAEIANARSIIEYAEMEIEKMESLKNITRETLDLMRTEYANEGTRFEELLRIEMELIDYNFVIAKAKYEKGTAIATLKKYQ